MKQRWNEREKPKERASKQARWRNREKERPRIPRARQRNERTNERTNARRGTVNKGNGGMARKREAPMTKGRRKREGKRNIR